MSSELESQFSGGMSVLRGPAEAYEAYGEWAFQHFLMIECRRAERAGRQVVLLLLELQPDRHGRFDIGPVIADRLFTDLTACVREVDFMGWYRAGQLIGAVLAPGVVAAPSETARRIGERVRIELGERLPSRVVTRLVVRTVELPARIGELTWPT